MKYCELTVWQQSMNLATDVYKLTARFPLEERLGLSFEIRSSAISIPSNIADGHGRKSTEAYFKHLSIAYGALMELETQLQLALRLNFVGADEISKLLAQTNEVGKLLMGIKKSLAADAQ
jgi:four helix bundle protein